VGLTAVARLIYIQMVVNAMATIAKDTAQITADVLLMIVKQTMAKAAFTSPGFSKDFVMVDKRVARSDHTSGNSHTRLPRRSS